jgi:hypothetical protein
MGTYQAKHTTTKHKSPHLQRTSTPINYKSNPIQSNPHSQHQDPRNLSLHNPITHARLHTKIKQNKLQITKLEQNPENKNKTKTKQTHPSISNPTNTSKSKVKYHIVYQR